MEDLTLRSHSPTKTGLPPRPSPDLTVLFSCPDATVSHQVAGLMVTVSCSWVHLVHDLTEGWVLGAFFCRLNSFAQGEYCVLIESEEPRTLNSLVGADKCQRT